ncbi:alpha-1,3-glucan synthase Ags1 [Aspergillus clavatus NRRL 1]|uniref:alpha-1,3-glucan synthase n=1 Tax=Aspergillus clavatus (strain ATCC 1007 / CBS 513.65 / DSM 816 / NCTC 3887 / NRRL 1 / QM 1276 / 107) TaxID=344612 RepID=A1CCX0_ASPCL|nr:alpha-1,3-glucan synthase, putative [Aspergillus clavatus NRRL 1]EAW12377.1 alpha-1,3-glucan synthase, putative [Aspergillus clavatus NRRL 1]
MQWGWTGALLAWFATTASCWPYDEKFVGYNLNENKSATNPVEYWGEWPDHQGKYFPSPDNWRFPFYTLFLDRFVNGDPTNDNINGTLFEHDLSSNQMRHGGDVAGLLDTLDYLQGMGIKGIYLAGTILLNQPWGSDGYSALDTTLLDQHFGNLDLWRKAITEIHRRGMYVVFDNTIATMGDLIGFDGYLNTTTPFTVKEHKALWKTNRRYVDFDIGNNYNETCDYPRFYFEDGTPLDAKDANTLVGCYDSDFDQYGDIEAFGVFPDWQRQLAKFASVQDRLREWRPSVRDRLIRHSCMIIHQLDIDGFRYDKATQATVDALGDMSMAYRECARSVGKKNFFISGEITGGDYFGAIYLGRGRLAHQWQSLSPAQGPKMTNESEAQYFLREAGHEAIDAAAFHYSIYRTLTRFLGMDGNLAAGYDVPADWVQAWNQMLQSNDFVNANTGKFDPRHMYGVTNQDVFRWPTIQWGRERQLLGGFVTTLLLPGIPLLLWGEEQAFYILDATAGNYIYGRQAMSPATAWRDHGCFNLQSSQYYHWPIEKGLHGCEDDTAAYDHRDPSHPMRNIYKHMYQLRTQFPVLNDGYYLETLDKHTEEVLYPGSNKTTTETGIWSIRRDINSEVQNFGSADKNTPIWLVFHNVNRTVPYTFDCKTANKTLNSPFPSGQKVKNLFYPFDEQTLVDGVLHQGGNKIGYLNKTVTVGCLPQISLDRYEFRAYVPIDLHVKPRPMITGFTPGHDVALHSKVAPDASEDVEIEIFFSEEMDCDAVTKAISLKSSTETRNVPFIKANSATCGAVKLVKPELTGQIPSTWSWKATLTGVYNGVHKVTVGNPSNKNNGTTGAVDHFLFRTGQIDNPMVFSTANYSTSLLHEMENGTLFIQHHAAGADMYRYSTNWGTTFSDWQPYAGGNDTIDVLPWSGTKTQGWDGKHVRVEYWSGLTGSSDYYQEGDVDWNTKVPRRFPHMFFNGPYNQFGYDGGLDNRIRQDPNSGLWRFHFMSEWPARAQVNIWGMNPDGLPDQSAVLGDLDGDLILDRMPPSSLEATLLNVSIPPAPHLAWELFINDGTRRYQFVPVGDQSAQMALYVLFWIIPLLTGSACVYVFMKSFYQIKFNQVGVSEKRSLIPLALRRKLKRARNGDGEAMNPLMRLANKSGFLQSSTALAGSAAVPKRRMVLIATMEYDIEDWAIKIKIGGLGVMAQLMGKTLGHQDLIWVVPCVGGVDYPVDQPAEPMVVTILGKPYEVQVQYHVLQNITYVLLDAPVFRQQSKSEPYPPRMDDLDSAIYYSAWNQCIAQTIKRFPIDLYHINDYHGSLAPLYLLPQTIPACLSLHNAEFQGLWPMRTEKEKEEVCSVFNLDKEVTRRYVQFGEVFNLLHSGASYLRVHQQGFGAVGVSKKYGKRSYARYPIFWGLKKVGNLPNPDPSDIGEWNREQALAKGEDPPVDEDFEAGRAELKRQAQEWAGLEQNPDADLLVFVGRWSMQKGVDLIADVMPAVLEARPNVQLICVGPVIDLYGKFAALKLDRMMKVYPGRVFSRPQFTALPPYIFSGAEFALIPSRDEPFGLVAVEFGRKGALGIGARVGGLGQMPGWWFNVESMSTSHLLHQFKLAIESALNSKPDVRAKMRARSAKQRFPVAQWIEDLEILQGTSIRIHNKEATKSNNRPLTPTGPTTPSGLMIPRGFGTVAPSLPGSGAQSPVGPDSRDASYVNLRQLSEVGPQQRDTFVSYSKDTGREMTEKPVPGLSRKLSLGVRSGPGHLNRPGRNGQQGLSAPNRTDGADVSDIEEESDDDDYIDAYYGDDEYTLTPEQAEEGRRLQNGQNRPESGRGTPRELTRSAQFPTSPMAPTADMGLAPPSRPFLEPGNRMSSASVLSVDSIVGDKKDFKLQKVDPFFTDSHGEYSRSFEKSLEVLSGSNSESQLCIEEFLVKSEKEWFDKFRDAKLGRLNSPAPSVFRGKRGPSPVDSYFGDDASSRMSPDNDERSQEEEDDEFLLGKDYVPPTGLRKWMQLRIGDWPVYSIFLGLGQIMAANSYQITLLTGEVGQTAEKLYGIATTYLITSILWWFVFRYFKSIVCLSTPWFLYGLAFMLIGFAHFEKDEFTRGWIQNVGSGFYAAASSSGSIFFALNFGDESGAPVKEWVFRACLIQGTQQAYVIALWYWGSTLTKASSQGLLSPEDNIANTWKMTAICAPIAILLWAIGLLMFFGLPNYYRQSPGKVPSFYRSVFRRKIVLWNFVVVIIQNWFLSAPYGRNWGFLWGSAHTHNWQIVILCIVFFGFVWAAFLFILSHLSKQHSWILPVFACGLGAPRWAQIWWGVSGIGYYLPWVGGGSTAGALASRSVWLWLGVLDAIQGLGFGMILLQTLTRMHMCFTLIVCQVLGSIATICARAFAPNNTGPGPISPDITKGASALANAWFWIALIFQLLICAGFLLFFRREQLSKP